eukprot:2446452-Pleurochrysis_carterae.AAC.3
MVGSRDARARGRAHAHVCAHACMRVCMCVRVCAYACAPVRVRVRIALVASAAARLIERHCVLLQLGGQITHHQARLHILGIRTAMWWRNHRDGDRVA